ncbi:hypothetical protein FVE85_3161 [Porphyridium purpureum]|uniref:Uncharacterized protein n=1 Tax=Porphyridium purpureum TaxID=35688 RepID=A0A5J4YVH1_PORPP|nr:hypothetical protein FVE85_3161 [Porphyridium purpureum]|eukprot:POR2900..scf227_4
MVPEHRGCVIKVVLLLVKICMRMMFAFVGAAAAPPSRRTGVREKPPLPRWKRSGGHGTASGGTGGLCVGSGRVRSRVGIQMDVKEPRQDGQATEQMQKLQQRGSQWYVNFTGFPFPLRPFFKRRTMRKEVIPGTMWTFEQEHGLGFTFVAVNIVMTVIRLQSGGLWVHSPIAPTEECVNLVKELGGDVEFIILGTYAYEHKIYAAPFSRKFPDAKVYTVKCWSWPINLPNAFFGIFADGELRNDDRSTPWADEIEQKVIGPATLGIAPYSEAAFFHKPSKTLIVTDAVVHIPRSPPEVIDRNSLLQGASDRFYSSFRTGSVEKPPRPEDFPEPSLELGWMRMALLSTYFGPYDLLNPRGSFDALAGRLVVSPVVRKLVYSRITGPLREFVLDVATAWQFTSIIPAHFAAPIAASPKDWLDAFAFVLGKEETVKLPEKDFEILSGLERLLRNIGLTPSDIS